MKANDFELIFKRQKLAPDCRMAIHPDFPTYVVSETGRVFSSKKNGTHREISPVINRDGYVDFFINHRDGNRKHKYAHRLVAELFVPNPEKLPEVNHKDINKENNTFSNLEWTTRKGNQMHASEAGKWQKLKPEYRKEIEELYDSGKGQAEIAAIYGVHQTAISNIWRKIGKNKMRRFTNAEVNLARRMYLKGISVKKIAERVGHKYQGTYAIVKNKRKFCQHYQKKIDELCRGR